MPEQVPELMKRLRTLVRWHHDCDGYLEQEDWGKYVEFEDVRRLFTQMLEDGCLILDRKPS